MALSVWARMRPSSEARAPSSSPAVSMMVKRRSASLRLALATVARDAGPVVDQRQLLAGRAG